MSKNKNKKKYVSSEKEHITISFCNKNTKEFKLLLGGNCDALFEELHQLHIDGKKGRSEFVYLTIKELKNYVLEKNPDAEKIINEPDIKNMIFDFLAALEWKQFYQIYRFNTELVKNLWDVDFDISSYDAFEYSEMKFLPCYSFYVEQEIEYLGDMFPGFFCRFDAENNYEIPMLYITLINDGYFNEDFTAGAFTIPFNSVIAKIEVDVNSETQSGFKILSLLPDIDEKEIGATIQVAEISCTSDNLVFKVDIYDDVKIDNGKVITHAEVSPLLYLFIQNRELFDKSSGISSKSLFETTIKITQLINYLIASNVDMTLTKKPDRKPYLQREHFNNADFCVWGLGNRLQHNKLNSGKTSNIKTEDTITIPLNDEELVNERKRYVQNKDADVLYHIDNGLEEVSENKAKRERTKEHNRPHMRKAHWTHYWYGKKDGSEERVRRRKFVSAVFVNAANEDVALPTREKITYYRFRD